MKSSAGNGVRTGARIRCASPVVRSAALLLLGVAALAAWATAARSSGNSTAAEAPAIVLPGLHAQRVIAYYFHTTYRCASCRSIEEYSHEALESGFADAIKDGRLVWKVVNVESKGNEHFVKDYSLYTKSLVLVKEVRGKRTSWKNLEKVWQLLQDKKKFIQYVQQETQGFLAPRS
ncbi:MAG TPA: nitrophenyl compound nitroreductase subunit ArsF family protein [Candidatus Eisenbacteria bacterium]